MELLNSPITAFVCAYLIGSIPAGLLLTRWVGLGDLRTFGSGNIGATNALRAGGKKLGIATLALDISKGIAGVWFTYHLTNHPMFAHHAMLIVMIGHCFPIWLLFKGGKGVATTIGALIAYYHTVLSIPAYEVILPLAAIWIGLFVSTRYVSIASILGAAAIPVVTTYCVEFSIEDVALALLIIGKHHRNICNFIRGKEYRFSFSKKVTS